MPCALHPILLRRKQISRGWVQMPADKRWKYGWVCLLLLCCLPAWPQAAGGHKENLRQADLSFHAGYEAAQKGDLAAAKADFQRVVQLAPEIAEGHGALGSVLLQMGQPALSVPELERALSIKNNDRSTRINLAVAYEETHVYDKSLALFRALDHDSSNATSGPLPVTAIISYVRALAASGSPDLALARMQKTVENVPRIHPMRRRCMMLSARCWRNARTGLRPGRSSSGPWRSIPISPPLMNISASH